MNEKMKGYMVVSLGELKRILNEGKKSSSLMYGKEENKHCVTLKCEIDTNVRFRNNDDSLHIGLEGINNKKMYEVE